MSITQGGCSVPFLAPPVYEYISTGKLPTGVEVCLKDIPIVHFWQAVQTHLVMTMG